MLTRHFLCKEEAFCEVGAGVSPGRLGDCTEQETRSGGDRSQLRPVQFLGSHQGPPGSPHRQHLRNYVHLLQMHILYARNCTRHCTRHGAEWQSDKAPDDDAGRKKSGTSCSTAQWGLVSPLNTEEGLVTPPQQVTLGYV